MKNARFLVFAAILGGALTGCNCGGEDPADSPDAGDDPSIIYPDGGTTTEGDGGFNPGTIKVACTNPSAPVPVNREVKIDCTIDSGGSSVGAPILTASPSAGVELENLSTLGSFRFILAADGSHPVDFADTTYTITVEVRNVAKPTEFGRTTVTVEVLGNYWMGAGSGKGVYVLKSDGTYLSQIIGPGPGGISSVSSLTMLPNGNIVASSHTDKAIRIFNRKGVQQSPTTFDPIDKFNGGVSVWDETGFVTPGPRQMAVSSSGDLWVAGAAEKGLWGIAVFDLIKGTVKRFLPHPKDPNDFAFTSLVRRTDGLMIVGTRETRTLCYFEESGEKPGECATLDSDWRNYASFLALPDARLFAGIRCTAGSSGCTIPILNPSMAIERESVAKIYDGDITSVVQSGSELLLLYVPSSYGTTQLARLNANTLEEIKPAYPVPTNLYGTVSGLVRLTQVK